MAGEDGEGVGGGVDEDEDEAGVDPQEGGDGIFPGVLGDDGVGGEEAKVAEGRGGGDVELGDAQARVAAQAGGQAGKVQRIAAEYDFELVQSGPPTFVLVFLKTNISRLWKKRHWTKV